jgi:hypothetical protein
MKVILRVDEFDAKFCGFLFIWFLFIWINDACIHLPYSYCFYHMKILSIIFECHALVWKELDRNILNKVINSDFVIAEEKFYKDYQTCSSTKINNKLSRCYSDIPNG